MLAEEDGLGQLTRFRHTATEAISSVVDPGGSLTEYDYDLRGRLCRVRRHGGVHVQYDYDPGDALLAKRDGRGNTLATFTPHANGYPARIDLASGGTLVLEYDARGRVREGSSTTTHDGRTLSYASRRDTRGTVLSDLRDGEGLVRMRLGTERTRTVLFGRFALEERNRAEGTTLVGPSGAREELYLRPDLRVERRLPNGTLELSQFDEEGFLTGRVTHKRASDGADISWAVRYERSGEGDLVGVWDSTRGPLRYELDAAHRLVGVDRNGSRESIELDPAGNVVSKSGLTRVELMEGNRLVATAEEDFVYDERQLLAGRRRRSDGRFTRYTYDSLNQLVRVEWRDATGRLVGEPWTADYDVLGRRVRFGRGKYQTELWWDGLRICAEEELVVEPGADGQPTTRRGRLRIYLHPSLEALVPSGFVDYASRDAAPESGSVYQVLTDPTGLPLSIEDARGETVWWATSTHPYGDVEVHPSSRIDYAMRWPGHRLDATLGLFYNRFRDYDPNLARYLQTDPIGQRGGINVYAYCHNPLKAVDLLGLAGTHDQHTPNPAPDGDTASTTAHPHTEAPPTLRTGGDPSAPPRGTDAVGSDGLTSEQRRHFRRLIDAAEARGDHAAAEQHRYDRHCCEHANVPDAPLPPERWRPIAERAGANRAAGTAQEQANRGALADHVGGSLDDNNAGATQRAHGTRPDALGDGIVGESKHFVTDSDDNPQAVPNTEQMDAQRRFARERGAEHHVVISSENPDLDATPPRPRPTAPLAERREGADGPTTQVHYAQSVTPPEGGPPRQMITHTWNPDSGTWEEATRTTTSGTVTWNEQNRTWDPS